MSETVRLMSANVRAIPPIADGASMDVVFELFRKNPDVRFLPVINPENKPLGVIREVDMKNFAYSRYGHELMKRHHLSEFISPCLVVRMEDEIDRILLQLPENKNPDGILVVSDGIYAGAIFNAELLMVYEQNRVELMEAKKAAEVASKAKSDFLSSMSHELRTPLNAIVGFAEVLQEQYFGPLNEKQMSYIKDIAESGSHLASLINDILDLSKVEAGKMTLELSSFYLRDLLENSTVMIKEKCHKHAIALETSIPKDLEETELMADERKLKQIMYNLLSNASKFTPEGGTISISALWHQSDAGESVKFGPSVEIAVKDTGIGISKENQRKVFDDFYQVQGGLIAKTPGTGLGLSLTRRFVELHGGSLWVESDGEGKGSTFKFIIPVRSPEESREFEKIDVEANAVI